MQVRGIPPESIMASGYAKREENLFSPFSWCGVMIMMGFIKIPPRFFYSICGMSKVVTRNSLIYAIYSRTMLIKNCPKSLEGAETVSASTS